MNAVAVFVIVAVFAFALLLLLEGYTRHLGNPEPTDWKAIIFLTIAIGAIGAGTFMVVVEVGGWLWKLFT